MGKTMPALGLTAALLLGGCSTANYSAGNTKNKVLDCTPVADLVTSDSFACSDTDGRQWLIDVDKRTLDNVAFWRKGGYEQAMPKLVSAANDDEQIRVVGTYKEGKNTIKGREVWIGDKMYPLN